MTSEHLVEPSFLFLFGGAMAPEEISRRLGNKSVTCGLNFFTVRLNGYRRRFGVTLPRSHYIPGRGRLVAQDGSTNYLVTSLEIVRAPGCFVAGTLTEVSPAQLAQMDVLEHICNSRPESGFMKRIEVTRQISPLPEGAEVAYAYAGTAASRRRCTRARHARQAAIPAYYVRDVLGVVRRLDLELDAADELVTLPQDLAVVEMKWQE
jgi:hypothetical protein